MAMVNARVLIDSILIKIPLKFFTCYCVTVFFFTECMNRDTKAGK